MVMYVYEKNEDIDVILVFDNLVDINDDNYLMDNIVIIDDNSSSMVKEKV